MSNKGINEMAEAVYQTAQRVCNPCPSPECGHPDCTHPLAGLTDVTRGTPRSVTRIADETVNNDRMPKYGPPEESFRKVANIVQAMLTAEEIGELSKGRVLSCTVVKVLIAVKLVRESYSPDHRDHLIDACGYIDILDKVK